MKRNIKKISLSIIACIVTLIVLTTSVYAADVSEYFSTLGETKQVSKQYEEWSKLSDEEKERVYEPLKYDIDNEKEEENVFGVARRIGASLESKYDLRDLIPENMEAKNQGQTNSCWAHSIIAVSEVAMALQDYKNNVANKEIYDFSEQHAIYQTIRDNFLNGAINDLGLNITPSMGGTLYRQTYYLANGYGLVDEEDMPFVNSEDPIDINQLNQETRGQIGNINFDISLDKDDIKTLIKTYGALAVQIAGENASEYTNFETGALYVDDATRKVDHGVTLVGWDDNYSKDNFLDTHKPTTNGAWIIKNSWGKDRVSYDDLVQIAKETISEKNSSTYPTPESVPETEAIELIERAGYTLDKENRRVLTDPNGKSMKIGDDGFMYLSYEDQHIYTAPVIWVNNVYKEKQYDRMYHYDELPAENIDGTLAIKQGTKFTQEVVFNKEVSNKEEIVAVGIESFDVTNVKVYIVPDENKGTKVEAKLKEGSTASLKRGYNTVEFSEPITITGSSFRVIFEFKDTQKYLYVMTESKSATDTAYAKIESGKCFIRIGDTAAYDMSNISETVSSAMNGDLTVRAYVKDTDKPTLTGIEVTKAPTKTTYVEGQNFDKSGMKVSEVYSDGTKVEVTDYEVENGTSLKNGQTSVNITYKGYSVKQNITVNKKKVTSIKVTTNPTKTTYKAGYDFDAAGMTVVAVYDNGTEEVVSGYTITNGKGLKIGQTSVTVSYEGKTTTVPVTVTENKAVSIRITKAPTKTVYSEGEDFDYTGMVVKVEFEDGLETEILNYTIVNGDNLKSSQHEVIIRYNDLEVSQEITVNAVTVTGISVEKNPTKVKYVVNKDSLDLTGGKIKVSYSDGSSKSVDMTNAAVVSSGFDNSKVGDNTITLTYAGKQTSFKVQIVDDAQVEPEDPSDPTEEKYAKTSDFKSAKTQDVHIDYVYDYTKENPEEYTITFDISGIVRADGNDSYNYYYYVSTSDKETGITKWVPVSGTIKDGKLAITIKSGDNNLVIGNNVENLYVYIKEEVKLGSQKLSEVSSPIAIDIMNASYTIKTIGIKTDNQSGNDNTQATGKLPQTGEGCQIVCAIAIMSIVTFVIYRRFKKLDK
jgi:C1A family cysteine protease